MTARDKAIELFRRVFNDAEKLTEELATDLVDAIVAATQATQTEHARAVQQEMQRGLPPAPAGYYYDGVNRLRCVSCYTAHPCPEHHDKPGKSFVTVADDGAVSPVVNGDGE